MILDVGVKSFEAVNKTANLLFGIRGKDSSLLSIRLRSDLIGITSAELSWSSGIG